MQCPYRHSPFARNPEIEVCRVWTELNSCTNVSCPKRHPAPNQHYAGKTVNELIAIDIKLHVLHFFFCAVNQDPVVPMYAPSLYDQDDEGITS